MADGGQLHPRVVPAVVRQGYLPEIWRCVNEVEHPDSYPMILQLAFMATEDFTVIEHDVESRPGFLDSLDACPEPWCFFAYDFEVPWEQAMYGPHGASGPLGERFAPLGHTRFKAGLYDRLAHLLESSLWRASWVSRDVLLCDSFELLGIKPHRHPGKALHYHSYK